MNLFLFFIDLESGVRVRKIGAKRVVPRAGNLGGTVEKITNRSITNYE